ncbi:hypothetical protein CONLIGDRAFT_642879 [Coniochaeta ligniaria NRRL 30616]|uniref:Uncharacterized protein n=1 Tax=Coniochaeta ligniaria NRRL 30616 TaxID=1408157 RepID=A0A1J7JND3_9PEZI|nr:hypothetical protein CONLIGDRAFT_642879 [Coniochaeta ligniaria NRRL 30616]
MVRVKIDTDSGTIRIRIPQLTGPENLQQWGKLLVLALRALNLSKYITVCPTDRNGNLLWVDPRGTLHSVDPETGNLTRLSAEELRQQATVMLLVERTISPDMRALLIEKGWDENNVDPNVLYCYVHSVLYRQALKAAEKAAGKQAEQRAEQRAEQVAEKAPEKDAERSRTRSSWRQPPRGRGPVLMAIFRDLHIGTAGEASSPEASRHPKAADT